MVFSELTGVKLSIRILIITFFICFFSVSSLLAEDYPSGQPVRIGPIKKTDKVLILAPHPDDESIACAGIIQEAVKVGADVRVVFLTNGDNNELAFIVFEKRITFRRGEFLHMGETRMQEAISALKLLGVAADNAVFLGYPDFGTFNVFTKYWKGDNLFRSMLTRTTTVPYKSGLSYGSPYQGDSILNDIKGLLLNYKPNKIFVSHPADINGDHKALYLFLQVALADLSGDIPKPQVFPYLVHCVGWPLPRHFHPGLALCPPEQFLDSSIKWYSYALTSSEIERKRQAILSHKTQTECCAFYLLSFARRNELFGDYPIIDLSSAILPAGKDSSKDVSLFDKINSAFEYSADFFNPNEQKQSGMFCSYTHKYDKRVITYALAKDQLIINMEDPRRWKIPKFSNLIYIFGYSKQVPFRDMPKIKIITKNRRLVVFDGAKRIAKSKIELKINKTNMILRVPLVSLGDPDFIFISLKSYSGALPIDVVGFRKIRLKQGGKNAGI